MAESQERDIIIRKLPSTQNANYAALNPLKKLKCFDAKLIRVRANQDPIDFLIKMVISYSFIHIYVSTKVTCSSDTCQKHCYSQISSFPEDERNTSV
jgi:hypothetical protein